MFWYSQFHCLLGEEFRMSHRGKLLSQHAHGARYAAVFVRDAHLNFVLSTLKVWIAQVVVQSLLDGMQGLQAWAVVGCRDLPGVLGDVTDSPRILRSGLASLNTETPLMLLLNSFHINLYKVCMFDGELFPLSADQFLFVDLKTASWLTKGRGLANISTTHVLSENTKYCLFPIELSSCEDWLLFSFLYHCMEL